MTLKYESGSRHFVFQHESGARRIVFKIGIDMTQREADMLTNQLNSAGFQPYIPPPAFDEPSDADPGPRLITALCDLIRETTEGDR